ncbi:MAG: DUF559 domain-containing protein, partial [Trebonia sp.]
SEGEVALAALAGRQWGVVSLDQLRALGFSGDQIRWRLAHARLHLLHHNVYAVGHRRVVAHAHLMAALLSVGPRAFLSHRTAAAAWGLRAPNARRIELTVPGGSTRSRAGLTVHRCAREPDPGDLRIRDGLRVSSVPRVLIELASSERAEELERLVTVAVQRRLLRPDQRDGLQTIEAALARHPRRPGISRLKGVLAAYRRVKSHKSGLELAFDAMLAEHPEIPDPERNVHLDRWEIDRCWRERVLAVELDGRPYHVAVRDMERDRIKDAALLRLGWTPLRFTDLRFEYDPAGVLADLRHFLGLEGAAP